ncbi:uncharacterized protein LOC119366052 isoform X2 [Triticum dicoccoides]|uniref:uncharacterized protein LOC119366052 isoform X2 n=1 Tax=Triticum dicoccoides TaxID=85692 RepID=UPI00188EE834|nr:uncharacterized protein LOC119366052 isoform X2 [Triticum dicoccoides]
MAESHPLIPSELRLLPAPLWSCRAHLASKLPHLQRLAPMWHLPDSLPALPAPSAPARHRLASSSTPASVELIHEARKRRREDWERVRGLRSERWSLALLLLDSSSKRNGTVPSPETYYMNVCTTLQRIICVCSWTASLEEVQRRENETIF